MNRLFRVKVSFLINGRFEVESQLVEALNMINAIGIIGEHYQGCEDLEFLSIVPARRPEVLKGSANFSISRY